MDEQQTEHAQSVSGAMVDTPPKPHKHGALATIDPAPFLAMLHAGKSLRDIANELGVSRQAIHAWMLREQGEQYHEAITAALTQRVADADERLDTAGDVIDIARAREQARFSRMDLERRRPGLYGQRTQVTHEVGPDLGELLREARGRVVSVQHTALPQSTDDSQT